jgi:hypothetical protein
MLRRDAAPPPPLPAHPRTCAASSFCFCSFTLSGQVTMYSRRATSDSMSATLADSALFMPSYARVISLLMSVAWAASSLSSASDRSRCLRDSAPRTSVAFTCAIG